jgi:two-component system, OmpR family, sensor histidine kinase ChvG
LSDPRAGGRRARAVRALSRIWIRLLAFNVLLVFLPAASLLYLDTYERQLLGAQERAMVQQGRVLAAALSGRGQLQAADARRTLVALNRRLEARLRVLDRFGRVVADSAALGPRREPPAPAAAAAPRETRLYRLGQALHRLWRRVRPRPELPPARPGLYTAAGADEPLRGPAVREALAGRYGADVRVVGAEGAAEGDAVTVLHSAIPVLGGVRGADAAGRVVGAVLVSQSTERILEAVSAVRLGVFQVILASVAAAVVLTLLLATTIARPLARLRDQAQSIVDRRGRLTGEFRGSDKHDEIGELARALEELTRRLRHHIGATEAFASDVSHELKNPLASIRSAAEMLPEAETAGERRRFESIVLREVARLEGLLSAMREIGSIDARMESEPARLVVLGELVEAVVEGYRVRGRRKGGGGGAVPVDLSLPRVPLAVEAAPERLAQVVENLLDNAVSFTRDGGRVQLAVEPAGGDGVRLRVEDDGPGISEEHLDRIFDRFFSYRGGGARGGGRDGHTGLGLAIVKAVVEGYGGTIHAGNRPAGGARFEVTLPRAEPRLR